MPLPIRFPLCYDNPMNKNPLVSIIIPVYNVEEYLEQCVDSVIGQTYHNLEIILVDDGSTDSSGAICNRYAGSDSRIHVIHKRNGGLSEARNAAIDVMKGEYVYYLDSDDYICDDLVETYLRWIEQFDADAVFGTFYEFWGDVSGWSEALKTQHAPVCYDRLTALHKMLMDDELYHGASGPLFKSRLYEDIRFPVGELYEDFSTTYYVIEKCERVVSCDDKRNFYRRRPDSITTMKVTAKNMILMDIADRVTTDMATTYPDLRLPALRRRVTSYLNLYDWILQTGLNSFPEEQKRIRQTLDRDVNDFLAFSEVKSSEKAKARAYKLGKIVYYLSCRLYAGLLRLKLSRA